MLLVIVRLFVGPVVVMFAVLPSIVAFWSVMLDGPAFNMVTFIEFMGLLRKATFVIFVCSAFPISPIVIPPIHDAITMATAMVTAISTIDAITGLRALLLFLFNAYFSQFNK